MGTNMQKPRETRIQASLLAGIEKQALIWMAERLPGWVGSDHLTALGAFAMLGAGIAFWLAPGHPLAFLAAVAFLAINWFGDSLDGTLARVRHQQRPRYGFYVDHVVDVIGILRLFSGLVALGIHVADNRAGLLIAYFLLTVEVASRRTPWGRSASRTGKWDRRRCGYCLPIGALQLLRSPDVALFGSRFLLFDVGGVIAIVALLATFVVSAVSNTRTLYRREPLPARTESTETTESTHHGVSRVSGVNKVEPGFSPQA